MKIFFDRDYTKERNKHGKFPVTGIIFEAGYTCRNSCWCKNGATCKYRGKWTVHNAMVAIQTFFRYRLGWKNFKFFVYFQKHHTDLSGTTKCPNHLPRKPSCHQCVYAKDFYTCGNTVRTKLISTGRYKEIESEERTCCKLFERDEWFDHYDRTTGDLIYDT